MKAALRSVIRDLHLRRGRERRGRTLVEGVRLAEEALGAGVAIHGAVHSPSLEGTSRGAALKRALEVVGVSLELVTDEELAELAATEHPQGIVAVVDVRGWTLADVPAARHARILALDAVQDPGNAGGMLRTARALGATAVIALEGTVELGNPKSVRASMGAWFRMPSPAATHAELLEWVNAQQAELWIAAAGGDPVQPPTTDRPIVIVVGNEGAGVSPVLAAAAHRVVAIPISPDTESLNVGVAAGILLHVLGSHAA